MGNKVVIIGAGVFGVTAAIVLKKRGYEVSLFDPGPLPHPLAASTDISKVVRLDYGYDEDYMALMEKALEGWREWNVSWQETLFHETGVVSLSKSQMAPGGFEYESFNLLLKRGHSPERLDSTSIALRFPAWNSDLYQDGYFNPEGGYAESGLVMTRLINDAKRLGIRLYQGSKLNRLQDKESKVTGIITSEGEIFPADWVVIAAGSWMPHLFGFLSGSLRSVGQPVFHLKPADPSSYRPERFPVFFPDVSTNGYYGFPVNRDGIVKVANHGVGRKMHPESSERSVTPEEEGELRDFLSGTFPDLAKAPIVYTRVCLYCDTPDEHFLIARDPERDGLVLATGGSGHAFKFAPVLGDIIADALEGKVNPVTDKFGWRPEVNPVIGEEATRYRGNEG